MRIFKIFSLLAGLTLIAGIAPEAAASRHQFFYKRYLKNQADEFEAKVEGPLDSTQEDAFDQKISHTDPQQTGTFKQRYFINSEYASGPNAPVIYFICGEATCGAGDLEGAVAAMAKQWKAHRIALEHRYYGRSQPFPTLTSENLVHLTTENALNDLTTFQKHATDNLGLKGKWLVVGGSYAGNLAAFYRNKFPNMVVGALASSAPVQARNRFEDYDAMVTSGVGLACAEAMRKTVRQIEAVLDDPAKLAPIKAMFGAKDVIDPIDFIYVVADMAAFAVQYGMKDFFCKDLAHAANPLQAYAKAGSDVFARFGITPVEDSFQGAESINPADYEGTFGMRAWLYQSCTEYGYWQVAHHNPAKSTRSSKISLEYHNVVCDRLFGIKKLADDAATHSRYYLPLLNKTLTSRILYTNGSTDPWSTLSISSELANNINPLTPALTITGAAHCDDLGTPDSSDSWSLKKARNKFFELATGWLSSI